MWRNFLLMSIIFMLSLLILLVTIDRLDPTGAQKLWVFISFYCSILFMVWSFFGFVFFFGAELFAGHKLGHKAFVGSLRRSFFVGLFCVCCVGLQYFRVLGLLEVSLLLTFFILLEWVFMTTKVIDPL